MILSGGHPPAWPVERRISSEPSKEKPINFGCVNAKSGAARSGAGKVPGRKGFIADIDEP